ncbi:SDR family oxidoreductase [Kutzneria sp. NPDC051319]|uniref:SDR family oxidoreductase n=1 Tax=Kutzneria sp. NPDC051319 TaxID=3155047 RepID=UPI00343D6B11
MASRKNIVITGASSGLGEGMARAFAAKGHDLALAARRVDRLGTLAAELKSTHASTVLTRELDVNDHEAVFRSFAEFRAELGSLDRVIVNAGISHGNSLGTGQFKDNRRTLETNLVAALAQIEAAMEIFREQRAGHLVVVASLAAARPQPSILNAYGASKSGLVSLAEGLRYELVAARSPIRVTTLLPGYIASEINDTQQATPPMMVGTDVGVRAMVRAIESETGRAVVPAFPYAFVNVAVRLMPIRMLVKTVRPAHQ